MTSKKSSASPNVTWPSEESGVSPDVSLNFIEADNDSSVVEGNSQIKRNFEKWLSVAHDI